MKKVASNQSEERRDGMITQLHSLKVSERRMSRASSEDEEAFSSCPSYESSEEPSKEETELGQPPNAPRPKL